MSIETSCHFGYLLQVSKQSLWSLILYILFHDFIHVYSPGAGDDNPLGIKFDVNRNILSLLSFVASFKKISLKSDFIHFFFHDFIRVYSPGQGQTAPGDKVLTSTEMSCHLLHVSKKSLWSLILYNPFSWFNTCLYPWGKGAYSPQGTKFWCKQKLLVTLIICC